MILYCDIIFLHLYRVKDVMTANVKTIEPTTDVHTAIK